MHFFNILSLFIAIGVANSCHGSILVGGNLPQAKGDDSHIDVLDSHDRRNLPVITPAPNCANPVSPSLSTISISPASPRGYETVTVTL